VVSARGGLSGDEREQLQRLRDENATLRMEREILLITAVFFARQDDGLGVACVQKQRIEVSVAAQRLASALRTVTRRSRARLWLGRLGPRRFQFDVSCRLSVWRRPNGAGWTLAGTRTLLYRSSSRPHADGRARTGCCPARTPRGW
jgi:hypothetical protein